MNLSQEQTDFLAKETGKPSSFFENMSAKDINKIRDICFDIECDETDKDKPTTPRGEMAADIVDSLYTGD